MATISKRKGAYQIIVSLGYDEAGKQIRKTTTYRIPEGTTPKKAEKLVKEYAMEFEKKCKGMIDLDENMKYSELSELYFKNYAPNKLKEVKEYYSKETIRWEIKAHNRTGTVEQMDANVEAMARDLQEILRLSSEQKRLWDRYERR